ncbi:MAG: DNA repair protein RecN [Rhizomicrobium sp.]
MLASLKVRDLVLIEDVALEFADGLNVLTGETGAGKSILLDALGLAAGQRAGQRASIRAGATQGSASAVFELAAGHSVDDMLAHNGVVAASPVILRRVISGDGRTRGFINDEPVGMGLLRDVGGLLVEIHGQSDDRGLYDSQTHRRLLDEFGAYPEVVAETRACFEAWAKARATRVALSEASATAARDLDFLHHAVGELSALAPVKGEEMQLAEERALLINAARLGEEISGAIDGISGDRGAETLLAAALKRLNRLPQEAHNAVAAAVAHLEQAFTFSQEARQELESILSRLELDSADLERKEERLFALRDAARKYGVSADDLDSYLKTSQSRLESIEDGGTALQAAQRHEAMCRERYDAAAARLLEARKKAALRLAAAVHKELEPLKLSHARFRCAFEALAEPSIEGLERVSFEIATVAGAPFGPLTKIASGGELARISLALKVALAEVSPPAVLIFDEIDRGVGGAVADAVGERLQRLASSTQILLVTHSPQVAARASRHFRISRSGDRTRVELLDDSAREEEIARMLAGAEISVEARAAARRLLKEAAPKRRRKS